MRIGMIASPLFHIGRAFGFVSSGAFNRSSTATWFTTRMMTVAPATIFWELINRFRLFASRTVFMRSVHVVIVPRNLARGK